MFAGCLPVSSRRVPETRHRLTGVTFPHDLTRRDVLSGTQSDFGAEGWGFVYVRDALREP